MKKISELARSPMTWVQTRAMAHDYELHGEGELLATLRWQKAGGTLAQGEADVEKWTFKRTGFLRPKVSVRPLGREVDLGVYSPDFWRDGTLQLHDGRRFLWKHTSFWRSEWAFTTDAEFPIVTFRSKHQLLKAGAEVEIDAAHRNHPDLALLVLLGWYLMVLMAQDAVTHVAITG